MPRVAIVALACALMPAGCSGEAPRDASSEPEGGHAQTAETARANAFFERAFEEDLAASPELQTMLGLRDDYDQWDDFTEAAAEERRDRKRRQLETLEAKIDYERLSWQARLSYRVFRHQAQMVAEGYRWRHHDYPLNQMFGYQSYIPSFLINMHRVANASDAEDYLARVQGIGGLIDQVLHQLDLRTKRGILPPRFIYDYVIDDARNVISGAPFDDGEPSPILEDFAQKVKNLELAEGPREELLAGVRKALQEIVGPAYRRLIERAEALERRASAEAAGVWRLPDGDAYYRYRLRRATTTELTPEEIHAIGRRAVERIHGEMRGIMERVGFDGSLREFFEFMRSDTRFYYASNEQGRQRYLAETREVIDTFSARLDDLFGMQPEAELVVKPVEPFRAESAGKAFYQRPAPDGSRPGIYYVNLHRMEELPTYQMEALAYHEAIPGHHMQIAIAQGLEGIPRFRRYGTNFTAYTEGWGLYAEQLPKELGLYADPYADFGRLSMELWRACRLVVDTGIHAKRWTREEAIGYLERTTPNPRGDIVKAVDRYIVMPGQATAYMIGMRKLFELRVAARKALGEDFDLRAYHDAVLANGALPLDVLEHAVRHRLGIEANAG